MMVLVIMNLEVENVKSVFKILSTSSGTDIDSQSHWRGIMEKVFKQTYLCLFCMNYIYPDMAKNFIWGGKHWSHRSKF